MSSEAQDLALILEERGGQSRISYTDSPGDVSGAAVAG